MAIWRGAVLTRAGNELLVMAAAGKQIIFTRLVTGCGIYTEEEKDRAALANATALKQQVQEFPFSSYEKHSEQSVLLKALINNKERRIQNSSGDNAHEECEQIPFPEFFSGQATHCLLLLLY